MPSNAQPAPWAPPGMPPRPPGSVVFLGLGNTLRRDDGFGPILARRLAGRVGGVCIDGGTAPENACGPVARHHPALILLLDAAHLGLAPGECRVLEGRELDGTDFTTHAMSPALVMGYLGERTGARVYMLAVQPASTSPGEGLSPVVTRVADALMRFLETW